MKKPTKRNRTTDMAWKFEAIWDAPKTTAGRSKHKKLKPSCRDKSLREKISTIIQRNHVARTTSDQTAREIVRLLMTLPPKQVFLGICADPCSQ